MSEPVTEWVTRSPAPALRPFIREYCGYRLEGHPAGVHRGLPSRHMTFIVSIGPPVDVIRQTDPGQAPSRYGCVLSGLQASSALIAHDGNQEGVEIELTPLGSRALLGAPARALWNQTLEWADVVGGAGHELWERLQVAPSWAERFAACDDVLLRVGREEQVVPELAESWRMVVGSGGQVTVRDLAVETGWSRQHLTRRFRDEFGLAPKLAARVVRFERAQRLLRAAPPHISIAQVAAGCGYYDHAHLDRDFAELAGCSPSELLTEDLPSFQDEMAERLHAGEHEQPTHEQPTHGLADPVLR